MVGDCAIGKSALIDRFVNNKFLDSYTRTNGLEISQKSITLDADKRLGFNSDVVNLEIWDCAGTALHSSNFVNIVHEADSVLLCFSFDNRQSFLNLVDWYGVTKKATHGTSTVTYVVALQCDGLPTDVADLHVATDEHSIAGSVEPNGNGFDAYPSSMGGIPESSGRRQSMILTTGVEELMTLAKQKRRISRKLSSDSQTSSKEETPGKNSKKEKEKQVEKKQQSALLLNRDAAAAIFVVKKDGATCSVEPSAEIGFLKRYGIEAFHVSAKNNVGVSQLFSHLTSVLSGRKKYYAYRSRSQDELRQIFKVLQMVDQGPVVMERKYRFRTYKRCFLACEMVDSLVEMRLADDRIDASYLGRQLEGAGYCNNAVNKRDFDDEPLIFRWSDRSKLPSIM